MSSAATVSVLGHDIEQIYFDGEEWRVICSCAWEAWGRPEEWQIRDAFDDHVLDDVNARLHALHDARKAKTL